MSWFQRVTRWMRRSPRRDAAPRRRVVVVSDLHMGEEVGEGSSPYVELITELNQEFAAFIERMRTTSSDPMSLVICGDSIDFIRTLLHPNPIEARLIHTRPLTPREARLGLGSSRPHAVWKLGRVVGFHRPVFEALARLVADGHELVIIRGNHDVELYWPEVREAIVETLVELAGPVDADDDLRARVRFEPWFYYVPGLLYAEHGHQYDPHCSYADLLDPVEDEGRSLALPYAQWSIRYFAPLLHGAPAADMEDWSFFDFTRFALRQPPARVFTTMVAYLRLVVDVLARKSWRHTVGRPRTRARHLHRLADVAERAGVPPDAVERIDALKEVPVHQRFLGMTLAFYVDRFVLLALTSLGLLISLLLPLPLLWRAAVALGVLGVAIVIHELLRRLRTRDAQPSLPEKALEIARLVEVPFVVFGHSHDANIYPERPRDGFTSPRRFYINSGHWVARYPESAFTYVELTGGGEVPGARLMRWRGAEQPAVELARAVPGETPTSPQAASTANKDEA